MTKQRKHTYHAEAFALGGQLRLPTAKKVNPLAHSKLDSKGGYLSLHHANFRVERVAWFSSAYTHVAGHLDDKPGHGWKTLATSVIEGLNVHEIVTADRIVTQISTRHPLEGYVPIVTFLGTRFENLRIAGHPVDLKLDLDILGQKPANDAPYASDRGVIDRIKTQYSRIQAGRDLPPEVRARYSQLPSDSTKKRSIECSLVNQVEGGYPGKSFGHVIDVPHFGKIYLATLKIDESDFDPKTHIPKKTEITLNMIELEMGCVGSGSLTGGSGKTNGGSYP